MSTIVEEAVKGQRKAMEQLYESNKRKVYYIAQNLLQDDNQAAEAAGYVFQNIWNGLAATRVLSEEGFTQLAVQRVVQYCMKKVSAQNPKAFRVPSNKNFLVPFNSTTENLQDMLSQMPPLQRYLFVLHTAGDYDKLQLARTFKFDLKVINLALDGEKKNIARALPPEACDTLIQEFVDGIKTVEVPRNLDQDALQAIDNIAKPLELKRQKQIIIVGAALGALCLCVFIGVLIASLTQNAKFTSSTGSSNSDAVIQGDSTANSDIVLLDEELIYYADIVIADYGTITFRLDQKSAPITAANFVNLAEDGFYDGLTFHRIMEGFMMQGGDPNGNGTGGSDQTIVGEFSDNGYDNTLSHTRGAVSMARSSAYDSASSQFFIVHEDSTFLNGQYAVFGYVTEGMEVVDAVCEAAQPTDNNGTIPAEEQPVITSITIRTE